MLERHQTARLQLNAVAEHHLDELARLHSDPEVMATLGGVHDRAYNAAVLQIAIAHWQQHGFGIWMAYDKQSGRFAGRGGLKHTTVEGRDVVEVLYAFLPDFWGRGLALELAVESIRVGFDELHLPELACFTLTTNFKSQRVMERAGFRYQRNFVHADLPHRLYRLTNEEHQHARPRA